MAPLTQLNSAALRPRRILVIALQFLGDVLLSTPLLHSLKLTYPEAQLDVLVYANTSPILAGNPDIAQIITTPNRPKWVDYRQLIPRIFRSYDLALGLQTGDRPFLYSLLAAPFRVSVVPPKNTTGWWKRYLVQCWLEHDDRGMHTVLQHLKLIDLINGRRSFALVPPQADDAQLLKARFPFLAEAGSYVVLHPHPQWTYKRWTVEGWVAIARYLSQLGYKIILSGSAAEAELAYIDAIVQQLPVTVLNLAGQVSLAQLAFVLGRAKFFIGPDTGVTHLAAATGVPVIALYGPTNPVKWAPWPKDYQQSANPFGSIGDQHVSNVYLCQGQADCVPCHLEGCDRHRQSRSRCLESLTADRVKAIIDQLLNHDAMPVSGE